MFFGAIALGHTKGPWHIFQDKTNKEKDKARKELK
jgi:hypothetical protein